MAGAIPGITAAAVNGEIAILALSRALGLLSVSLCTERILFLVPVRTKIRPRASSRIAQNLTMKCKASHVTCTVFMPPQVT